MQKQFWFNAIIYYANQFQPDNSNGIAISNDFSKLIKMV